MRAAASASGDYQARLTVSRLDELASLRLARVRAAGQVKAQTLAIAGREQRIREEIKMYLTLEYGYLEYLTPWAAARLRRETWGDSPPFQGVRDETPARRAEVAGMFLSAAANMERLADETEENRASLRVRCLRAAEYFGGSPEPKDRAWLARHAGGQVDILSND